MRRTLAAGCTVLVAMCGCTTAAGDDASASAPRFVQPGAPGEPGRELTAEDVESLAPQLEPNAADVAFMRDMVPHHAQALWMTRLVATNTSNERIALLTERMDLSQRDELDLIVSWLEEQGEPVPSMLAPHEHEGRDEPMPGMLTEEELRELEAAQEAAFDRLFLESMIRHHAGAMWMVEQLYDAGGRDPEVARFANHVLSDQQIEISRMEDLLGELDAEIR
jgi:uncharacterized protein (DUF305 family)